MSRSSVEYAEAGKVPARDDTRKQMYRGRHDSSVSFSLGERTSALYRGLELILCHNNASEMIKISLKVQLEKYLNNVPNEKVWLSRVKYLLAYPLAKLLRCKPPKSPDVAFLPSGPLRHFMKAHLVNYCYTNAHLWYSWLQCKRSCLPMSEELINQTYHDHHDLLTKPDSGDDEVIKEILSYPTFKKHIDDIRIKLDRHLEEVKDFTSYVPSTNASFLSSRDKGGSVGEISRGYMPVDGISYSVHNHTNKGVYNPCERSVDVKTTIYSDELDSMTLLPIVFGRRNRYNVVISRYGPALDERIVWKDTLTNEIKLRLLRGILFGHQPTKVMIQGILEPNKVRVISKGPALEYYAAKRIQVALHDVLREMPAYRLIGRPLSPTDILDLRDSNIPDPHWFSVDYTAATDNLSWKYSSQILSELTKTWSQAERDLAFQVLGPAELHYPTIKGQIPPQSGDLMRRGQLMGSVLSFPILCIANMGVFLYVTKVLHNKLGYTDQQSIDAVLINGDDMLYYAPSALWDDHVRIGEAVGLEMSVGKAYCHPSYANINSTGLTFGPKQTTPRQINFLNTGLFFGQNKVLGKTDREGNQVSLIPLANLMMKGSLPGVKKQVGLMKMWISRNLKQIRDEQTVSQGHHTHRRNLFLPLEMGGCGIIPPPGFSFYVTRKDRVIATTLSRRMGLTTSSHPLPGYPLATFLQEVKRPDVPSNVIDDKEFASMLRLIKPGVPQHAYIRGISLKRCQLPSIQYAPNRSTYVLA
jgi:hypothetical protein